jgi:hypothetical protein
MKTVPRHRIVMMTNGPEAEVGDILDVKFPRPRNRKAVLEHPAYYEMREYLMTFLNDRADIRPSQNALAPTSGNRSWPALQPIGPPESRTADSAVAEARWMGQVNRTGSGCLEACSLSKTNGHSARPVLR